MRIHAQASTDHPGYFVLVLALIYWLPLGILYALGILGKWTVLWVGGSITVTQVVCEIVDTVARPVNAVRDSVDELRAEVEALRSEIEELRDLKDEAEDDSDIEFE